MARQRKTWKQAEVDKTASPPPQIPAVDRTEGPDHPAYHEDPDKDKYKSGDTSAWAEDPHKPRSPETPPPAMPGNLTTEELEHPGTSEFQKSPQTPEQASAAGGKQAAEQPSLKKMAEERASLCVKIAAAMMPGADAATVEDKALELMDLDDAQLRATASTLKVLAGEEEEEEEEEITEIEAGKKANLELTARLDKIEASMGKLVQAMTHFFGGEGDEEGMTDKELMAYLMAEDTDGDGVDQNAPDYGYSEKSSGEEEPVLEEAEITEIEAKEAQEEEDEEEAMLRAMLEEMDEDMGTTASSKTAQEEEEEEEEEGKESGKKKAAEDKDASAVQDATAPLAKGPSVQSGEGGNVNPDEYPPTPRVSQADGTEVEADPTPHGKTKKAEDTGAAENDIEITAGVDPLGLMSEETKEASADDELAQLYADLDLPKTAQEEAPPAPPEGEGPAEMEKAEEEAKEEGEEESPKASKKAKEDEPELKPQQKVASSGAQKLGNVAGTSKTAASEVSELQKLWESAPDVSQIFGVPRSG